MKKYIFALVTLCMVACSEDNETIYSVDPALQPYVDTFYSEAAERGTVMPKNLIAEFSRDIQGISQADRNHDQNYVFFKPEIFNSFKTDSVESEIESNMFNRLSQVFLNRNNTYQDDHEAMFDALFQ